MLLAIFMVALLTLALSQPEINKVSDVSGPLNPLNRKYIKVHWKTDYG